jgi:hypothetical protein
MLVATAITQILARGEDAPDTDADDDDRRLRTLENIIEVWVTVWLDRPWPRKRKSSQLTMPAGQGYIAVPSDFQSVGHYGGVFQASTGKRLDYVNPQEMQEMKRMPGNETDDPSEYSFYDQETSTPFAMRMQTITNTSQLLFDISFEKVAPTLSDGGGNDSNLNYIPEAYQQAVIIPGAKALAKLNLGDITQAQFDGQMRRALRLMRAAERPGMDTTAKLPSFLGHL